MASAANPSSSSSLPTSQPPLQQLPPSTLRQCPIANEDAVASDSSLSQNNPHSIRSTPASSLSVQRPSPNLEVQGSTLQPGAETELSNLSSHGYLCESSKTETRPISAATHLLPRPAHVLGLGTLFSLQVGNGPKQHLFKGHSEDSTNICQLMKSLQTPLLY